MRTVLCVAFLVAACSSKEDPASKPIDAKAWREKHRAALDAWIAKRDAAVALTKDLPPVNVRHADPEGTFQVFLSSYANVADPQKASDTRNAVFMHATETPGLPEYASDRDKAVDSGEQDLALNWMGYISWENLNVLLEGGTPKYGMTAGGGDSLVRDVERLRYLIMTRAVDYKRGSIDSAAKTFTPSTYRGVAHVVDLQGPKHLGSITFSATNTGSFESYSGSEKFMLYADLQGEAMRAFHAEWKKTFPKLALPEPPKPDPPKTK